jgi:hypothetical protein
MMWTLFQTILFNNFFFSFDFKILKVLTNLINVQIVWENAEQLFLKKIVRIDYPLPNTKTTSLNNKIEKLNHKF